MSVKNESILQELKEFEASWQKKLDNSKENAIKTVSNSEKSINMSIEKEKIAQNTELKQAIKHSENEAAIEGKEAFKEYISLKREVRKEFEKNKDKTVDAVFKELIG